MEKFYKVSLKEELKKNKELQENDIKTIKEWIKKSPHLPNMTDIQIVLFLKACNFSLERTKGIIDLNYTLRTRLPELFSERDLSRKWLQTAMANVTMTFMPERDINGNVVIFYKLKEMEMANWNMEEYVKLSLMVQDYTNCIFGSVPGYVFVIDLKHMTFSHILQCPISTTSNLMKYAQEASNCVIKGSHFINAGSVIEKLFSFINPFLKAEVQKTIKIHTKYETLIEEIGKKALPCDYGGTLATLEEIDAKTRQGVEEYQQFFFEEMKQRVDEKKRSTKDTREYGIKGSFKKIEVD